MEASPPPFGPPRPLLTEEWDDPAMIELMRQQSEDRVAFAESEEAARWLRHMQSSRPVNWIPCLVSDESPAVEEKTVVLPW